MCMSILLDYFLPLELKAILHNLVALRENSISLLSFLLCFSVLSPKWLAIFSVSVRTWDKVDRSQKRMAHHSWSGEMMPWQVPASTEFYSTFPFQPFPSMSRSLLQPWPEFSSCLCLTQFGALWWTPKKSVLTLYLYSNRKTLRSNAYFFHMILPALIKLY